MRGSKPNLCTFLKLGGRKTSHITKEEQKVSIAQLRLTAVFILELELL